MPRESRPPSRSIPVHVYRQLERWVRDQIGAALDGRRTSEPAMELRLALPITLRSRSRPELERRFTADLERAVAELATQLGGASLGWERGHVFCHWCSRPACEHSRPSGAREVFIGYEPTGRPRWRDFGSWVVEQRDARLDRLFADPPVPLAIHTAGASLVRDLLGEFGKHDTPYRIVGQVSAGGFPHPAQRGAAERTLAITCHLVEARADGGDPRYGWNIIHGLTAESDLGALVAEHGTSLISQFVRRVHGSGEELRQELIDARGRGQRLSLARARRLAEQSIERVPDALEKLARRRERRTDHAAERALDPSRPTARALADALAAPPDRLFRDRKEDTIIVRGPRNRVHVFRTDGAHITSVVYPGETIRDRLRSRRWSPLPEDEAARLRAALTAERDS